MDRFIMVRENVLDVGDIRRLREERALKRVTWRSTKTSDVDRFLRSRRRTVDKVDCLLYRNCSTIAILPSVRIAGNLLRSSKCSLLTLRLAKTDIFTMVLKDRRRALCGDSQRCKPDYCMQILGKLASSIWNILNFVEFA